MSGNHESLSLVVLLERINALQKEVARLAERLDAEEPPATPPRKDRSNGLPHIAEQLVTTWRTFLKKEEQCCSG